MTTEEAIKWLNGLKANEILSATKKALDIAIKALETGEVYMTGEDYNLYMEGYKAGKKDFEPKQGEREFIEILAQNVPEDLCTYSEYKGKPYYSIHYKENGEEFVGFGTYKIEVLSRYLKDYFMKGGAE